MSDINKLYDSIIKTHNASPYNFIKIKDAAHIVKAHNAICGDRYEFYIHVNTDNTLHVHFHGYGCAVSMAAGSVLVKYLEKKDITEGIGLCESFLDLIHHQSKTDKMPEEFLPFMAVKDFPMRYDCAAMCWKEMKKYLENISEE